MAQSRSNKAFRLLSSSDQKAISREAVNLATDDTGVAEENVDFAKENLTRELAGAPGAFQRGPSEDIENSRGRPSTSNPERSGYANVNSQLDKLEEFNRPKKPKNK